MAHDWTDNGIMIGARRLGENDLVIELLTEQHGRHFGMVRGGRSRRLQPMLQLGNLLRVRWRARLEEQLGWMTVEPVSMRAGLVMDHSERLLGLVCACALARLAAEREPHDALYDALNLAIERLSQRDNPALTIIFYEISALAELGFGLDLSECAATGQRDDLRYVSPKTGRAVCSEAGLPYAAKLLPLPQFLLTEKAGAIPSSDLAAAFRLTGFFLSEHILTPRGLPMPPEREHFLQKVLKSQEQELETAALSA